MYLGQGLIPRVLADLARRFHRQVWDRTLIATQLQSTDSLALDLAVEGFTKSVIQPAGRQSGFDPLQVIEVALSVPRWQ